MKTSIPRTLLTAIPALAAAGCTESPAPRPNVIFILMDDAGYGDFGCYGQTRIETPNIASLAARGIRFTDMYSAAPLSSPARCGLLTGMHTGHAQIRANDEMEWRGDVWNHEAMLRDSTLEGQAPLEAGTPTLGSVMQQAGYATAMLLSYIVGQKKNPVRYPLKSIGIYVLIAGGFYAIMACTPEEWPVWTRLGSNTVLILLFVGHILKHDLPVRSLPVIGKYFRKPQK